MPEFKRVVKVNEIKWEYSNKLYRLFCIWISGCLHTNSLVDLENLRFC